MHIKGRHEWGAAPPRRPLTPLDPDRVTDVFVHHTTGEQQAEIQPWLHAIQKFHQESRGWNDIGYSYIVDRNGTVWEGRGRNVGAHTKGFNSSGIGIAYLGDGEQPVPDPALRSLNLLIDLMATRYPIRIVRGHRNVGRTACPGEWLYGWLLEGRPMPQAPSPIPDVRDGWRRHLAWMRSRR